MHIRQLIPRVCWLIISVTVATGALADEPVPFLKPEGQQAYANFLNQGFHRVFAISPGGGYGSGWSNSSLDGAKKIAFENCQKRDPGGSCAPYSIGGYVVWQQDAAAIPRYAAAPKLGLFVPSDYTPVRGPKVAKGVIIWSHGYFRGIDATQGQPQGYVSRFHAAGWDVYRYNREYIDQMHKEIAEMIDSIAAARQAGYAKVVIAGQSHGAWISLEAFARNAAVDGVISVSPAHHGSPPTSGARSDFRELLRQMRKRSAPDLPVVIALFDKDSYDPGGRFADIRDMLEDAKFPLYYIDRPAELTGHGAGNGASFNERFGPCIARFVLDTPHAAGNCR
jgi:dienelactone hydrolase